MSQATESWPFPRRRPSHLPRPTRTQKPPPASPRQRAIERLTRQTEEQSARIDALAERGAELDTLRKELEEIRSNRVAAVAPPAAVFEDSLDILDTDDDEIVVPMPASAVDEFELDEPEEEPQPEPGRLHHNLGPTDDRLLTPTVLDLLSMDFDGTTTPTVVESAFTGLSGGGFTIEAWIRPAQTRLPRTVLSYSVAGSSRFVLSGGGPRPSLGVELDGHTLPDDLQPRLIADVWQHVGVSWDSSGGRLTVYLDGALAFSGEIAPSARIPGGGRLLLGQQSSRGAQVPIPGRAYEGGLAEVRVWSHVRSPTEIQRDTHRRVVLQDGLDVWRVGLTPRPPQGRAPESKAAQACADSICLRTSSMSSACTFSMTSSRAARGSIPACWKTPTSSRLAMRVGMDRIWK